jgi:hypothetical protein
VWLDIWNPLFLIVMAIQDIVAIESGLKPLILQRIRKIYWDEKLGILIISDDHFGS